MKYFKIIIVALIIVNIVSCQNKTKENMNWEIIDFSKIPGETFRDDFFEPITKYKFNQILTINENNIILLGDNSGDRNEEYLPKESEAIAFVSIDGGETLLKHNLGKGSLMEAKYIDGKVFLINETSKNGKNSSQLIKSDSLFKEWKIIKEFKTEEIFDFLFFSKSIGLASFGHENPINQEYIVEYRYTLDGGENWSKIINSNNKGFTYSRFISSEEIEYIENNKLVKFNFITGEKEIITEQIVPRGYKCIGYYEDTKTKEYYTSIENLNDKTDCSIKYTNTQEIIQLPKGMTYIVAYGNYLHAMVKEGIYYNYVWSDDKGKTWNTEKLRDFFVIPRPIKYYGKGYVYAFVTCFKGSKSEKGGRFAIRKPAHNTVYKK